MKKLVSLLLASAFAGGAAQAADVSQAAIDACEFAVSRQAASDGGTILGTEYSEANSLVMIRDQYGVTWRCLVDNAGQSPWVEVAGAQPAAPAPAPGADYADGMSGGPDFWQINVHGTLNLHSGPSTGSPTIAKLHRGLVVENRGCRMNEGRKWCEIADGDVSGWAAGEYLVEAGGPAPAVDHSAKAPTTETVRVRFATGTSGQMQSGALDPGSSARFILGAGNGQTLEVSFVNTDPAIEYQIFLPNGRHLLDAMSNSLPYQGQLFMGGDHVVEVINRSHRTARYAVYLGIY